MSKNSLKRFSTTVKKLTLRSEPTKAAAQACVVVSIPFAANYWTLRAFCGEATLVDGTLFDESAVAYAVFEDARDRIMGNSLAAAQYRASAMYCNVQGGHLLISVVCDRSLTSARKCAGSVIQSMKFGSLNSRYSAACRRLGVSPNVEAFAHAANAANNAAKDGITVVITGKVSSNPDALEKAANTLSNKFKSTPHKNRGRERSIDIEGGIKLDSFVWLSAGGINGYILKNYLEKNVKSMRTHLVSGKLYYPANKATSVAKLGVKSHTEKYGNSLMKLKEEAKGSVVHSAARECAVLTNLLTVGGANLDASSVEKYMRDAINAK